MPLQNYNDQGVNLQAAIFQRRNEPNFAFSKAMGALTMIPGVVGAWSLATLGSTLVPDATGLGMALTINGGITPGNVGIAQYLDFNGTTGYLSRANEANILPSTNFACGGWFRFDELGSADGLIVKWDIGNNKQFALFKTNTDTVRLSITTTGVAATQNVESTETLLVDTWYYIAGYYLGGTELAICINKTWYSNTTAIPASLFAGTAALEIGRVTGANYFNGKAMLCWLAMRFATMPQATINTIYEQTRALFAV